MTSEERYEQELADAEREAYLADGDRRDAQDLLEILVRSPLGLQGGPEGLVLAARAHAALCSARRREIAQLNRKAGLT